MEFAGTEEVKWQLLSNKGSVTAANTRTWAHHGPALHPPSSSTACSKHPRPPGPARLPCCEGPEPTHPLFEKVEALDITCVISSTSQAQVQGYSEHTEAAAQGQRACSC